MNQSGTALREKNTSRKILRQNNMNETFSKSTASKSNFNRTITLFPSKHSTEHNASHRTFGLEPEKVVTKSIRTGEHVIIPPQLQLQSFGCPQINPGTLFMEVKTPLSEEQVKLHNEPQLKEDKILKEIAKLKIKIADKLSATEKIQAKVKDEETTKINEEDKLSKEIEQYKETYKNITDKQETLINEHKSQQEFLALWGCFLKNVFKIDVMNLHCQEGKPCVPLPDVAATDVCHIFNCPSLRINHYKTV